MVVTTRQVTKKLLAIANRFTRFQMSADDVNSKRKRLNNVFNIVRDQARTPKRIVVLTKGDNLDGLPDALDEVPQPYLSNVRKFTLTGTGQTHTVTFFDSDPRVCFSPWPELGDIIVVHYDGDNLSLEEYVGWGGLLSHATVIRFHTSNNSVPFALDERMWTQPVFEHAVQMHTRYS